MEILLHNSPDKRMEVEGVECGVRAWNGILEFCFTTFYNTLQRKCKSNLIGIVQAVKKNFLRKKLKTTELGWMYPTSDAFYAKTKLGWEAD